MKKLKNFFEWFFKETFKDNEAEWSSALVIWIVSTAISGGIFGIELIEKIESVITQIISFTTPAMNPYVTVTFLVVSLLVFKNKSLLSEELLKKAKISAYLLLIPAFPFLITTILVLFYSLLLLVMLFLMGATITTIIAIIYYTPLAITSYLDKYVHKQEKTAR